MFLISRQCILSLLIGTVCCLEVIPESIKIVYFNEKYMEYAKANVRRYGRKSAYYINIWGSFKQSWGNNITIHLILTEYLHNEYRRSFIEFHYKFCDLLNSEPYLGEMIKKSGLSCPIPKGEFHMMNMTVQTQNFPNVFPFEKGGAMIELTSTDTGERVGLGEVHAVFRQKRLPRKN